MNDDAMQQARDDRRDNKRAFRWAAIAAGAVVVLVLAYNMVSQDRHGPLAPDAATSQQRQAAPAPAPGPGAGGSNDAAGPGTGGGRNTGAATGTGQPAQPGK